MSAAQSAASALGPESEARARITMTTSGTESGMVTELAVTMTMTRSPRLRVNLGLG
jgi:hypothetical protein